MSKNYILLISCISFININLSGITSLSCTTPTTFNTSGTITLDCDFTIDSDCELVQAIGSFGDTAPDIVTFTATQPFKIIVTKTGIWNMSSFNTPNKIIKFAGKAQLVLQTGAKLKYGGGQLIIAENSQFITINQDA